MVVNAKNNKDIATKPLPSVGKCLLTACCVYSAPMDTFGMFSIKKPPFGSTMLYCPVKTDLPTQVKKKIELRSGKHIVVVENERGVSYEKLFGPYLEGAAEITIYDPYIRQFYQIKNVMEFLQMVLMIKAEGDDVRVKLKTKYDDMNKEAEERLSQLKESFEGSGIDFDYEFDQSIGFHARSVETDTGWKITLDRGLDIFQPYDFRNPFNLANNIQEERQCKQFEVTFLRK